LDKEWGEGLGLLLVRQKREEELSNVESIQEDIDSAVVGICLLRTVNRGDDSRHGLPVRCEESKWIGNERDHDKISWQMILAVTAIVLELEGYMESRV
jgi:hypothetical protein